MGDSSVLFHLMRVMAYLAWNFTSNIVSYFNVIAPLQDPGSVSLSIESARVGHFRRQLSFNMWTYSDNYFTWQILALLLFRLARSPNDDGCRFYYNVVQCSHVHSINILYDVSNIPFSQNSPLFYSSPNFESLILFFFLLKVHHSDMYYIYFEV